MPGEGGPPEETAGPEARGLEDPRAPWEKLVEDPAAPRAMLAVLFTDIVGSTELASGLGDKRWRELIEQHNDAIRAQIERFGGREVDTAGDAFFATFGLAVRAVDCALESARAVRRLGLRIRAGVHMGECVVSGNAVRGVTVHIGARVGAKAKGDEVLVSSTVRDILGEAGLRFADRGEQTLKGVEGRWRLHAVEPRERDNEADLPPLLESEIAKPPEPFLKRRRSLVAGVVAFAVLAGAGAFVLTRGGGLSTVPADSVAVIDANSGAITSSVLVGRRPVGLAAFGNEVWVANSVDRTVAHISRAGSAVARSAPLGAGPAALAIGGGIVYVANVDGRSVSQVDRDSAREIEGGRLQSGNGLSGIAYGAGGIWISNAVDGSVWRFDEATGSKTIDVRVGQGLRGLAVDGGSVWVTSETAGTVTHLDAASGTVIKVVQVGNGARAVSVGAGGVWVANTFDGTVSRVDPNAGKVTATIRVGKGPRALAITRGRVFVANEDDESVSVIDAATNRVTRTISLGNAPMGLAASGDRVWVSVRGGILRYRGGTLRFGTAFPVRSFDPAFGWSQFHYAVLPATHDGLIGFKKVGGVEGTEILPNLAEELLPPTNEGKTYSFRLRAGLKYSDGSPVRATDVRKSFERMFVMEADALVFYAAINGAEKCSPKGCDLSKGIVTNDETRTVIFHLRSPVPDFPYHLAHPTAVLVPAATEARDRVFLPIPGTGPYMVSNIEGREGAGEATLVRNPHFRSRGPVQPEGYPDRIVVTFGENPQSHIDAIKAGTVDWTIDAAEEGVDTRRLATEYPAQFHLYDLQSVLFATLNPNIPPLDDVRIRRAINYAVDRRAMAAGVGAPLLADHSCQILAKDIFGYESYCPYTKNPSPAGTWTAPDLTTARRLVAESGKRGAQITIWVVDFANSFAGSRAQAAKELANAIRSIGLRAVVRPLPDFDEFLERIVKPKEFQILMEGWAADYPSPSNFFLPLLACPDFFDTVAGRPDASANATHFCSPEIDAKMKAALAVQQEDPLKSAALWAEVDRALTDAAAWVPYATIRVPTFVSARVGNVQPNPAIGPLMTQMWLTDRK